MSTPRRLLVSPRAAADMEEIADYIARDNPARAATFVAELQEKCRAIVLAPEAYPARPELAAGLRMTIHGRYLIFFRDEDGLLRVERVLHGARDLRRLFQRA